MKILSRPEPVEAWHKQASCQTCMTTVELEASDLYGFYSEQRDGSSVKWRCPTCARECWLDAFGIPQMVIQRATRKAKP